jgi:hypothetical protein
VTDIAATFNGTVNASGNSLTMSFEYGTTTSYGSSFTASPSSARAATPLPRQLHRVVCCRIPPITIVFGPSTAPVFTLTGPTFHSPRRLRPRHRR